MKKIFAMMIAVALVTALMTACGNTKSAPSADMSTESAQTADDTSSDSNNESSTESNTESSTESNAEAEEITLTFWHTYGDAEDSVFQSVVMPMWEAAHPNVKIESVRQDGGQFNEMIITSFGTGQSPDVARIDIVNTASYANQGGLLALDSYDDFAALSENFLAGPLSTNLYKGNYYGLPLDTNCKAAVINTTVLAELGLTETDFTMEEFIAASAVRGRYSLNVSGVGDWDLYPFFWLFGGVLTDDAFTKASGYLDSAESVAAIEKLLELHEQNIFTIRDVDGSVDAWDGINSEYAMFFEGPWYFGAYEEKAAQGIEAATIPTYQGRSTSVVGGENLTVFSAAQYPDAAYEFCKFMTSEEVQLAMLESGQLPVLKSLVNNQKVTSNPVWAVYMEQLNKGALARIPSPNHTSIGEIWSDAMLSIFVDGSDVQATLSEAAAQIDGQLN